MIRKGTSTMISSEIDEKLDYYGANMSVESGYEEMKISMSCLKSVFVELLPFLKEVVFDALFPEKEFVNLRNQRLGKLKQILANNDEVADRSLGEQMIGVDHPFGYVSTVESIEAITLSDLQAFYKEKFNSAQCIYYMMGDIDEVHLNAVNDIFKPQPITFHQIDRAFPLALPIQKRLDIPFDDKMQHALKIGYPTISSNDENYPDLIILHTLFGGYFGSRLMTNIREDKGYTYGIYASLFSDKYCHYAMISAEVGKEHIEDTIAQIKIEVLKLQNEKVKPKELNILKKYMIGEQMRAADGSFRNGEMHYRARKLGLPKNHFEAMLERIHSISSQDIKNAAKKFINFDKFYIVVV
jgi:zinc protease